MKKTIVSLVLGIALFGHTGSLPSQGQSPGAEQPGAKLIVEPPAPELLAKGLVSIQYRTENVRIMPVFGPDALKITPRVGHLHVRLDDAPWGWTYASGQPVIVNGLSPGRHRIQVELADANHQALAQNVVEFEVPQR